MGLSISTDCSTTHEPLSARSGMSVDCLQIKERHIHRFHRLATEKKRSKGERTTRIRTTAHLEASCTIENGERGQRGQHIANEGSGREATHRRESRIRQALDPLPSFPPVE